MQRAALILFPLLAACGADNAVETAAAHGALRWPLPDGLREISGLALTADQRLLAVGDEQAIVYELDYTDGRVVKSFALGDPVVRGDFEGIAVLHDEVWLMTSEGDLYRSAEGAAGSHVSFETFPTGHGEDCELEGLAQDAARGSLLLVCKEMHTDGEAPLAFEWEVADARLRFRRQVVLPQRAIAARIGEKRVNPSAAAVDPANGEWVLLAARQRAIFRTTAEGGLVAARILPDSDFHRQAEGVEITRDGRLLTADEGGDGRANLAVYPSVAGIFSER